MRRRRPFSPDCESRMRIAMLALSTSLLGCHVHPPGGNVIQPQTLGASVDEANRQQEENAELAKMIVYSHEFESNLNDAPTGTGDESEQENFRYVPAQRPRGFRLTPDGQDHVRQIAKVLVDHGDAFQTPVIIERSRTSKHWDTKHHYPVHFNDELDAMRREVVVAALFNLGVANAEDLVIVAPAFPTGLSAVESGAAYSNAIEQSNQQNGGTRTGRR